MTTQLNPAWQRKTVSSDHLARVSARFLSDAPRPEQTPDGCQVIPFLLDNSGQNWIPGDLCHTLTERGHRSQVRELLPDTGQAAEDIVAATLRGQPPDSELCLLTSLSPAVIHASGVDHVVMLVPASLDSVSLAYQRIKLLSRPAAPHIGIVVVGARDQHAAWRYFRKLAVGTLRFLDVPLLNLGFLPHQVTPQNGPADHHRDNFLARISERLLRSEFFTRCESDATAAETQTQ